MGTTMGIRAVLARLGVLMLFCLAALPARAGEFDTTGGGELYLGAPGQRQAATRVSTQVEMHVSGMLARVNFVQTFRNDGQAWNEAIYVFPLPENAAVDKLRLVVGERVIEGEIRERAQAKAEYAVAKATGRRAALVEQERANLFTTSLANIAPGEEIRVELSYLQTLRYESGEFRLRFPMTFTPRYIPGLPATGEAALSVNPKGWAAPTDQVPDAHCITPPIQHPAGGAVNPISLRVELDPGFPLARLESRYHTVTRTERDGVHEIRLDAATSDHDFELVWAPAPAQAPFAAVFKETVGGEDYALVMLMPPQAGSSERLPRELVLVVDTSGSMGGVSIRQAREALALALDRLTPADRFNLIQFNSYTSQLYPAPVQATAEAVRAAKDYVAGLEATGGTEMAPALATALAGSTPEGYLRQVVFITDGAVGNEDALFGQIAQQLGAARLFTVGIGSAPNSHFMTKAAEFGRGSYTFIGSEAEVRERMGGLFGKLESPVLRDLCLRWPVNAETYPERVPDLYAGEPVVVAARVAQLNGELELCGQLAGQPFSRRLNLGAAKEQSGIAATWARRKISRLLDRKRLGGNEAEVRAEVLPLALKHRLVSPYTSFVATEQVPARPEQAALETERLANNLPQGSDPRGFGLPMPRTATPAALLAWGGLASLLMAAGLALLRRQQA